MKYESIKLKYLADIFNGNSIPDDLKSEYEGKEIPYIPTKELNVEDSTINYNNGLSVNREDGFKIAPTNSVLMCIEGGSAGRKIALTDREVAFVNKLCCISGVKVDSRYLFHALRSKDFTEQFFLNMTGLIGGVSINVLKNLYVSLPSNKETQRKLISILDQKCGKIDKLIANQQGQIEKLKEYKQSIITEAVTKGLDKSAPMKDSGIEWIGEIPADWELVKIGSIFKCRNEKVNDTDYPPLSVSKGGVVPQMENVAKSDANDNRKLVLKNDFVINSRSDRKQSCGVSPRDGSVSLINTVLYTDNQEIILSSYVNLLMKNYGFAEEFYRWGHGIVADLWTTRWQEMKSIVLPLPSIEIQEEILCYVKSKMESVDSLIAIKQEKIEKLQEYKKSLIYEYVTGKKQLAMSN